MNSGTDKLTLGFCRRMNFKIAAVAPRVPQPIGVIDKGPLICISATS